MCYLGVFSILEARDINLVELLLRVLFALIVGGIVGGEREHQNRPAGMRTHMLVCLGACAVALLESLLSHQSLFGGEVSLSLGRLSAQVISGIGFLGAGTIIMTSKKVSGLTTAASVWNIACLGLLIGHGYYLLALLLCLLVLGVLQVLGKLIRINAVKYVEVKFVEREQTLGFINSYFDSQGIEVLDVDFHVEARKHGELPYQSLYTNLYTLQLPSKLSYIEVIKHLSEHSSVQSVRTRNT